MKYPISFFFPAYNEKDNIQKLYDDATNVLKEVASEYEILFVVYEGSTDGTIDTIKKLVDSDAHVRLIIQPKQKKGVGYAIKMGFDFAKHPYIFYADSDNQFDLKEFKLFLPYMETHQVIAGYRINRQDPFLRIFTSKVYNIIIRMMFGTRERDVDCAFRLVHKDVFEKVTLRCFLGLGTSELLVKARKYGFKIKEVGVHHLPRYAGVSVFEAEGIALPKPKVVVDLIKEMQVLKRDLRRK